jgi:1-acyl-sn-glycerol-3-phosphate acyltransferase
MNERSAARAQGKAGLYARSILFALLQYTITPVFAVLAVVIFPLPFPLRFRIVSQWARINLWWLRVTCGVRVRVHGRENIPGQPCIVLSKHQSAWETLFLQQLFIPQVWVVKRSLLWVPFFGWGLAMMHPIAIDRSAGRKAVAQVIQQGRERLENGAWVVIFPEGTRIPPGRKGRYRMGGAVLASSTGAPVLPIAHNAGEVWPRNSFLKLPGTVQLEIGPLIPSADRSAEEIIAETEAWIEGTMQRIGAAPPPKATEAD